MRTFSKAYGMAGLRVGYAYGNAEIIRSFEKIRNHFGMNRVSQAAALAALKDQSWIDEVVAKVAKGRAMLAEIATAHALVPLPSATNFVTMDCGADANFAKAVLNALEEQGVFIRMPFAEPGNRCIRITVGTDEDIACFKAALPRALEAARGIG